MKITARYAGINVGKVIVRTVGISGGIAGIAGFILVSGSSHTISTSTAGGRGFTAIIVAWLASLMCGRWQSLHSFSYLCSREQSRLQHSIT